MRRSLIIAGFSILLMGVLASTAGAQGSLAITYTTQSHNGPYAPTHVVVVWVEGPGGAFVKTLDRRAGVRSQHLVAWRQKAGAADVDAVTGATRLNHTQPLSATWDLRDRNGSVVPDGAYTIRMELADSNATQTAQNAQGTFTFTKTSTGSEQTGLSNGGFTNVSITHTPGTEPPGTEPPPTDDGGDTPPASDRADTITGGCAAGRRGTHTLALGLLAALVVLRRRRSR